MKEFAKELASSPRQFLTGQGVQRVSGLQKFEARFGSRKFLWKRFGSVQTVRKERSGYVLSTGSKVERARSSICWLQR